MTIINILTLSVQGSPLNMLKVNPGDERVKRMVGVDVGLKYQYNDVILE